MKKIIFLIALFLISGVVALQGKITGLRFQEKFVSKTVQFSIFASGNYRGKLYKKSKAKVVLTVYKLNGNTQEVLWETVVDKGNLRDYPQSGNPLFRNLTFYNIREHHEDIVASYKVIYNNKNSELSYEQNCLLNSSTGDTLMIAL